MLIDSISTHSLDNLTKPDEIIRKYSFTAGEKRYFRENIKQMNNSSLGLIRSQAVHDLTLGDDRGVLKRISEKDFEYSKVRDINAKNYVYCGSATTLPLNNFGMSIDNNGRLILIKGKSYDFFKGVIRKYTTGYKYKTSPLIDDECGKKFTELYLDDEGVLVGREKETGAKYIINISIPELDTEISEQVIAINFLEYDNKNHCDDLAFKIEQDFSVSYFIKDGKLYLKSIQKGCEIKDYSCLLYEIKLPLSSGYRLSSIKRAMGVLQIEVENGNKKRIFYIDPKCISNEKLSVTKISHKPPQSFSSRVGNDPHEKYHAGLPFTSDRKANFSSKNIPLFSSMVDNYRTNIKYAKQCSVEGRNKKALMHIAKAIDPGVSGFYHSVSGLVKSVARTTRPDVDKKEKLFDQNIHQLTAHSKTLSKVANEALGVNPSQNFSETLINLANELKPRDLLQLANTNRIAAFFGIANGGIPFAPGWFAGVVAELSHSHNLTISKTETGNIRLAFNNRHKTAVTGLAGTGQGLEKTVVDVAGLDFLTVLPVEANAIIATQAISANNFSFELTEQHFQQFAAQFSGSQPNAALREMIITEAEAKTIQDKEFIIKIESKNELRLQAGTMVDSCTYMVMPRTAVGLRLALELLNVKSSTSEAATQGERIFSSTNKNLTITALNHEAALFAEWKIMPIAMSGCGEEILWCYPLPLLEEACTLKEYSNQKKTNLFKPLEILNKSTPSAAEKSTVTPPESAETAVVTSLAAVQNTPMYLTVKGNKTVKKGLKLKRVAQVDRNMRLINETIRQLRKSLINQQRVSQNKSCVIEVVSHYQPIMGPSLRSTETGSALSSSNGSENKSYRLKKLEFRRHGSLQHKNVSVPMPILNFSNINGVTYNQFLGEILFQYESESDLSPINIQPKLVTLY